jgi:hypothetical protein
MAKKKDLQMQQGSTSVIPQMPASALTNPLIEAAKQAGIIPQPLTITPPSQPLAMAQSPSAVSPTSNMYKGVDLSKPFSNRDFANPADYEQAKLRVNNGTSKDVAARQILDAQKAAQVKGIVQQANVANLDPALLAQAQQLGTEQLPQGQQQGLDYGLALKAGGVQAAEGALAGAAGGAILGGGVNPVTGAIGAAGVGVAGFIRGFVNNLKSQRGKQTQANFIDLQATNRNLRFLATDQNQGGEAAGNIAAFNEQLARVDQAYANLKLISQKKPMGEDDLIEMARFEDWYAAGGAREHWINEMQQAIYNPNPSKNLLTTEDYADALA